MKTNCWLLIGTMIATGAMAQVNTNTLPEIPAPATVAPAPTAAPAPAETPTPPAAPEKKKPVVKKKAVKKINEPTVSLTAGPATVLSANLNVRGKAGLRGEVINRLKQGDTVTVISQINLDKHALDEPAQWAKIALPAGTEVWVSSHFVDAATKTVSARRLNLRAGPGENYGVLGMLEKGASVTEISTKPGWIQIQPPADAFAFVAAMYLKQEAAAQPTEPAIAAVPPQPTTVTDAKPIMTQPPQPPLPPEPVASAEPVAPVFIDDTNPPPPRVVSHQGVVRSSVSPVAPTPYELYDPETGVAVNYLFTTSKDLDLSKYAGLEIIATGEEGIAPRWVDTPVLTLQKIFVISSTPPEPAKRATSPRAAENKLGRAYKRH
jgi:uncharacterized protein YgiM (DUF1202 family)